MEKEYSKDSKNLEAELFRRFIMEQKKIDSRMKTVIWWVIGAIVPIFFTHKINELKELASLTKHATVYSLVAVLGVAFYSIS